jgi:hypothetical protein
MHSELFATRKVIPPYTEAFIGPDELQCADREIRELCIEGDHLSSLADTTLE